MLGDENSLEAQLLSQTIRDGIVYLAYCQNWGPYLKIGCSINWIHRQCMLQTGTPENVRLWAFARNPAATDLIMYEYQFHLKLAGARHPLGREFFKTDVTSFKAVARELNSPMVRSREEVTTDLEEDVSLAEDLKSVDYDSDLLKAALL
jgi:hypothetical protein